jgi:hypothetical protein
MDPPWRFGVDDRYDEATEESQRNEPLLTVVEAIVLVRKGRAREHFAGIDEV